MTSIQNFKVNDNEVRYKLTSPKNTSRTGILFIPGGSGGSFERWKEFTQRVVDNSLHILQFESWYVKGDETRSLEQFNSLTLHAIHEQVTALLRILEDAGCNKIGIVGKSAGGAIAITYPNKDKLMGMSLWAPPIKFSNKDGNQEDIFQYPFKKMLQSGGDYDGVIQVPLYRSFLERLNIPTQLIHAKDDTTVPIVNTRECEEYIKNLAFCEISNGNHSYKDNESKDKVFNRTINFFKGFEQE